MKATMQHTKDTIYRLSRVQHNTYCQGQKLAALILAMVLLFLGAAGGFSSTTSMFFIFSGCLTITGMNTPADRNAKKVIDCIKGDFPKSEYLFEDKYIRILGDGQETLLPYTNIFSLICDGSYIYLFISRYSAYMVSLTELEEGPREKLKNLLRQKTGLTIQRPGSLLSLNLTTLLKGRKKK